MTKRVAFFAAIVLAAAAHSLADDVAVHALPVLKVPDGFSIELVAGPPLVERPIVASFDDEGRLYVAESSGSNDPVAKQLEDRPHRIARLEDTDGDGTFDRRTTFADKMMFPEGALFFDGSLYVAAPPSIWKLTDTSGDGVADERVEWFQGKTLTGCANDLHGPYAGPDGWLYWCKGAFAEQTHIVNGKKWTSKASHIFRCRPDGSGLEPVITAGMDNPVDVVFMPDGEMILSGTLFQANPRRDGLAHAVYGGVYGKQHHVLEGHPRTGELMPVFDSMSPVACSGLERYDSDVFGAEYRDNLFLCQFNVRKVSRHILKPAGSTYTSEDSDFVWSDFVDFHPTDVVVDADGSLLVVDTGGWYKLCCPTTQLYRPDVLGGIYRVQRVGATPPDDPRGRRIAWVAQSPEELWALLSDTRPAVRQRAIREFAHRKDSAQLTKFVATLAKPDAVSAIWENEAGLDEHSTAAKITAVARTWALAQMETERAQSIVCELILDNDVGPIAMHTAGLRQNASDECMLRLEELLDVSSPANRRAAAEALGRIGVRRVVPNLLESAVDADDRVLQHSIIYALIEVADPKATREGLASKSPKTIAAALIALDQMPGGDIQPGDVIPHLGAVDDTLRDVARWVVAQHPDWGGELTQWLDGQLNSLADNTNPAAGDERSDSLQQLLAKLVTAPAVQQLMADAVTKRDSSTAAQTLALRVMAASLKGPPKPWVRAIATAITKADPAQLALAIAAARRFPLATAGDPQASRALAAIATAKKYPIELRVDALAILVGKHPQLSDEQFQLLDQSFSPETPVAVRSAAAHAIFNAQLTKAQLVQLCDVIAQSGPLEMNRLLKPFDQSTDEALGLKLIGSLEKSAALPSLRMDLLRESLAKYGPVVQEEVAKLESLVNIDVAAQRRHIEELLPLVAKGDIRRGNAVFFSSKATCSSCHRLGNAGGTSGPELTHLGDTRTERDILESILYPSLSFVRSFEPVLVTTQDGKTINGTVHEETADEYVLATGPDQEVRVRRDDVEEIVPSRVSIMPAGLDKQLSPQELADLVAFLKNGTGRGR